jgi:WD40 repeat protein
LLDLDTGTREPFPVTANVDAATFSRGGEVLVCVSKDNTVTLLEAATGAERARFRVEGAMLFGWVGISPDGKIVVTTGKDLEDLIAWDVDTGRRQVSFGGPGQNTGEGVFSPDGRWLVTFGSRASFAKLWTVPEFAEQITLAGHSGAIFDASFAPDSKLLATTSYDGIRLWDVPSGRPVAHFTGHIGPANALAFSPDGEFLAAGFGSPGKVFPGESPRVELWHVGRGQVVARWLAADRSWITGVGFTPDGTRLVTVKSGGEGKVWDVRSVTHSGE